MEIDILLKYKKALFSIFFGKEEIKMRVTGLGRLILWVLKRAYRVNFDGQENLEALRNHLKEGSVILAFNHISLDDTFVLGRLLLLEVGEIVERVIIPGSRKWWGRPVLGKIMRLTSHLGAEVFPVVQHYQKGLYSPEETFSLLWQFSRKAREVLGTDGGVIFLAPEGTRSKKGRKLQSSQTGIESLLRLIHWRDFNTKIMPIGIEPQGRFNRWINPGRKFVIHFGPLLSVEEIEKSAGQVIMEEIALLLPAEYSS